jgi:hypothetical protein
LIKPLLSNILRRNESGQRGRNRLKLRERNATNVSMFAIAQRIWKSAVLMGGGLIALRALGFVLVMGYALRQLTPEKMGLWQVLLALVAGSAVIEMGLSFTIGRFGSYFMGGARSIPRIGLAPVQSESSNPNYEGIVGLIAMARRLYAVLAILVTALAIAGWIGWSYLKKHPISWQEWCLVGSFALGSGINMAGMYWAGLLFGLNRVRDHQRIHLVGMGVSYFITAVGLRLGWGVWALMAGQLILSAIPRWWARVMVLRMIPTGHHHVQVLTFQDVWAMTWRTGFVTAGGYLMCQASALVYSLWVDLDAMASFGLTLQAILLLRSLGDTWLLVKWPWIGAALTRGAVKDVRRVFIERSLLAGLTFAVGFAGLVVFVPWILDMLGSRTPLSAVGTMMLIAAVLGLDLIPGSHSALLLNFNRAPHAGWYLVTGLCSITLAVVFGGWLGPWGVLLAPLVCGMVWLYWRVPVAAWAVLREGEQTKRNTVC